MMWMRRGDATVAGMKLDRVWIGWISLVVVACAGDDAGDSAGGSEAGGSSSAGHGSTASSTGDETSATATGGGTTGSGADGGSSSEAGTQTSAADSGGSQSCGELTCDASQICVQPCCGGPAPACEPLGPGATCAGDAQPVPADQCPGGCDTEMCCLPIPCVPDPPHCLANSEVVCDGSFCSAPGCQGTLAVDGSLLCECA